MSAGWSGGSWQQARGAVAGGSWQKAPTGGSGSSSASSGGSNMCSSSFNLPLRLDHQRRCGSCCCLLRGNGGDSSRRLEGGWKEVAEVQELEAAGAVGAKQGGAESQFNCCINGDALARQSQLGGGAARGGCSQCSREGLGVTQPHSLSGLRVVLERLVKKTSCLVCASPIVGPCHNSWVFKHQSWGEGNDPAAVDCWQFWST